MKIGFCAIWDWISSSSSSSFLSYRLAWAKGRDTRLDAATTACRRCAALVAGCRRGRRGRERLARGFSERIGASRER